MININRLNSMSGDELWQLHWDILCHPRIIARQLNCKVREARTLAHYAANKATALSLRRDGIEHRAIIYENICEKLYAGLPEIVMKLQCF